MRNEPSYKVESSTGELFEFDKKPSMRAVKQALGITGRRCAPMGTGEHWQVFSLCGTPYLFTVTEVA